MLESTSLAVRHCIVSVCDGCRCNPMREVRSGAPSQLTSSRQCCTGYKAFRSSRGTPRARRLAAKALLQQLIRPLVASNKKTPLNEGIAAFYDESSGLWEAMWGQHMHHGYYPRDGPQKSNAEAQVDMIRETLSWAGVEGVEKLLSYVSAERELSQMVDVGCGVGGSSRFISETYNARAEGITLSPKQAQRANELSRQQGLETRCSFRVADALQQPFEDASFDLVWSLESGEHMPDKQKFVGELVRVCAPGGRVIIVTWCHRNLEAGESSLRAEEQSLLDSVCDAYYLPAWCSLDDYEERFRQQGMQDIKTADWSDEVAPFWGAVIRSALSTNGIAGLLKAGWTTIKGALVMPLMAQGYRMGVIRFVLITGRKPQ